MLTRPTFNEVVGAILALVALSVVAYLAAVLKSEQAAGAVIALLAAGAGYLYRGRVEKAPPDEPLTTAPPEPPLLPSLIPDPTLTSGRMPPPP